MFYGAIGTAARGGLSYLPIYLGPILLVVFGSGLSERLMLAAKERNVTSIADFIASQLGKSHSLAALVTVIAVTAVVPYLALQLKAVSMSFDVMTGATGTLNPVTMRCTSRSRSRCSRSSWAREESTPPNTMTERCSPLRSNRSSCSRSLRSDCTY